MDDIHVRTAARDVAAKLHRHIALATRQKQRKAVVIAVNTDNTVDIMVPSEIDPTSGDTYPRVHRLGEYNPVVGDTVWWTDHGHGRYLVLGSEIYNPGGGPLPRGSAPYQARLDFFSPPLGWVTVSNAGAGLPVGSMSNLWFPRVGTNGHAGIGRFAVGTPSIGNLIVDIKLDGITTQTLTLPPATDSAPFLCDIYVPDGSFICAVVTSTAEDVRVASLILDMDAI